MRFSRGANGYKPKLSPDGEYVASGDTSVFTVHLPTGNEWLLGLGGQCHWSGPRTLTYIAPAANGLSAVRHVVTFPDLTHRVSDEPQDIVVGDDFVAAEGHWANTFNGRLVYDGQQILEADASKPRVAGDFLAYIVRIATDRDQIRVQSGLAGIKYSLQGRVAELDIARDGTVAFSDTFGHVGLMPTGKPFIPYPYQGPERCLSMFTLDGRPWIATVQQTTDEVTGEDYESIVLRDIEREEFLAFPVPVPGITELDVVATATELIMAAACGERLIVKSMQLNELQEAA